MRLRVLLGIDAPGCGCSLVVLLMRRPEDNLYIYIYIYFIILMARLPYTTHACILSMAQVFLLFLSFLFCEAYPYMEHSPYKKSVKNWLS
jgi:hypothetical protein